MIEYMMPGFLEGKILYTALQNLQNDAPHMLYPEQKISFIYGCVPNAIWNGGTMILHQQRLLLRNEVEELIKYINKILGLPIAWTFTNPLIEEKHIYDTYCNMLAEVGHDEMNYILVNSPILEKYLREHYPKYKYCRSILAAKDIPVIYDDPAYAYSVLQRAYNNNFEYLQTIPQEYRHKIEILATDQCPPDCPYIYTHYNKYAIAQMTYNPTLEGLDCMQQQYSKGNPLVITKPMIDELYAPLGYTHFKLSGRGDMRSMIDNVVQYFILPDYQELVDHMLKEEFLGKRGR